MIVPLAVGNAVRLFLQPPAGALLWRVLRKAADTFTGEADPDALLAFEGADNAPLDIMALMNGTAYWYRVYYWNGTVWSASASRSTTPAATYEDASTDVPTLLRDRLDAGLVAEIARGKLFPEAGFIKVSIAPPAWEDTGWPTVSVHCDAETRSSSAIGEMLEADIYDAGATEWDGIEGWLSDSRVTVTAWSQNVDERAELRKALRRIVIANLGVFADAGMLMINFSQQDMDFVSGEYPANVYTSMGTFTCQAPARVIVERTPPVTDIEVVIDEVEAITTI